MGIQRTGLSSASSSSSMQATITATNGDNTMFFLELDTKFEVSIPPELLVSPGRSYSEQRQQQQQQNQSGCRCCCTCGRTNNHNTSNNKDDRRDSYTTAETIATNSGVWDTREGDDDDDIEDDEKDNIAGNDDIYDIDDAMKEYILDKYRTELKSALQIKSMEDRSMMEIATERLYLYDKITQVQREYLLNEKANTVFNTLLDCLLECTGSEYGFIGEVLNRTNESSSGSGPTNNKDSPSMYLQSRALTNIAWDTATREFYEQNKDAGLQFTNLNTLFGTVMISSQPLIANNPSEHPKSGGIPPGHPPLDSFLGIPFFLPGNTVLDGMIGIANKPGGYNESDIAFLEPLIITCSNLVQAYRSKQENDYLINKLEDKVKQRTEELNQANVKLMETARMQMEHFACMSHEIRTPLNCVVGLSSVLAETELNPFQKDSLQMILQSSELLMAVVNDVLDYSKLQTGNMDIKIHTTNLQDTLDAVVHSIIQKAREKHVTVKTNYDPTVPEIVQTDSRRLQQILYNLLGNAIKFSHINGTVELSVHLVTSDTADSSLTVEYDDRTMIDTTESITVVKPSGCPMHDNKSGIDSSGSSRCPFTGAYKSSSTSTKTQFIHVPNDCVSHNKRHYGQRNKKTTATTLTQEQCQYRLRFIVKDYGKGIAEDDFETIFQPFQQASASHTPSSSKNCKKAGNTSPRNMNSTTPPNTIVEGTGLGLAITSRLVEGLGGTIHVDSVVGQWSEFSLEIPLLGTPVDPFKLSIQLQDITLLYIGADDPCTIQQMFRLHSSKNGDTAIPVYCYPDCTALLKVLSNGNGINLLRTNTSYICLMDEELYNLEVYSRIVLSIQQGFGSTCILASFGPNYSVPETRHHYRSIHQTLPSVIFQSLIRMKKQHKHRQPKRSSQSTRSAFQSQHTTVEKMDYSNDNNDNVSVGTSDSMDCGETDGHKRQRESLTHPVMHSAPAEIVPTVATVSSSTLGTRICGGGSGSSMTFAIPADLSQVQTLIAEDNVINQKILVSMLQRIGVTSIDVVENGKLAYEYATERHRVYDIIFMDMQMPIMSGIEATERIVETLGRYRTKPIIIFVTAHATTDYETKAIAAGGNGFISKPFKISSIRQLLESISSSSGLVASSTPESSLFPTLSSSLNLVSNLPASTSAPSLVGPAI